MTPDAILGIIVLAATTGFIGWAIVRIVRIMFEGLRT